MIKLNKLSLEQYNELIERLLGNFEGYSETPYFDTKRPNRHVTIGRGFDIEPDDSIGRQEVFNVMEFGPEFIKDAGDENQTEALRAKEKEYVQRIVKVIKGPDTDTATLQKSLNKIMAERSADPAFRNIEHITSRKTFRLTGPEIEAVYTAINRSKEGIIDRKIATKDTFGLSRERAVLVEMAYQGIISERSAPLREAIVNSDNRAEAWFQIRYKGHIGKDDGPGQSSRHYREAEAFSLYYDPASISLEEAKQVYRMFQKHKDNITAYEKMHGPHGSVKTKKWHRTGFEEANYGKKEVKTVGESFAPAKVVLLAAVKEQYRDNPKLVAKLTDAINHFRPIDNHLNVLKESEKQPPKAQLESQPVHAAKETVQHQSENIRPEGGFLSKIGEMGHRMHDSDVEAAKAQTQIPELIGSLLDKMFSPANSDASEISPLKMNRQIMNKADEQHSDYRIVPASELRETASDALYAMYTRELEIRGFIKEKYGRPMNGAEIEVSAVFSHLTKEEQGAVETAAKLTIERAEFDKQTQQRSEVAEAYGYNRFYARIPNFLKNKHQKGYDQWGRELEQKELDLNRREEANRPELEKTLAKIITPGFQEKKARTMEEITASDTERINKVEAMREERGTFTGRRFSINYLMDKLPEMIGRLGIGVKGDPKDIENLLAQSDQIAAQTKPAIEMTRQRERTMELT
jgi:hypothetical protein